MGLGIIPRANSVSKHYISDYEAFFQVKLCMPITLWHKCNARPDKTGHVIGHWVLGVGCRVLVFNRTHPQCL
jgi:hypothetical protein